MSEKYADIGATLFKRMHRGSYHAEIKAEGNLYRFVIRDESHQSPSIHGAKRSLKESESEVEAVLDRLCDLHRAA